MAELMHSTGVGRKRKKIAAELNAQLKELTAQITRQFSEEIEAMQERKREF